MLSLFRTGKLEGTAGSGRGMECTGNIREEEAENPLRNHIREDRLEKAINLSRTLQRELENTVGSIERSPPGKDKTSLKVSTGKEKNDLLSWKA